MINLKKIFQLTILITLVFCKLPAPVFAEQDNFLFGNWVVDMNSFSEEIRRHANPGDVVAFGFVKNMILLPDRTEPMVATYAINSDHIVVSLPNQSLIEGDLHFYRLDDMTVRADLRALGTPTDIILRRVLPQ